MVGGGNNNWRNAPPPGLDKGNAPAPGGRQQPSNARGGRGKAVGAQKPGGWSAATQGGAANAGGNNASAGGSAPPKAAPVDASKGGEVQQQQQQSMSARVRFVHEVLVGHKVQVQVKGGITYEGILHSFGTPSVKDYDVVLLMAETLRDDTKDPEAAKDEIVERPTPKLVVHSQDVIQITARQVKTDAASVGPAGQAGASGHEDAGGFGTDSSISRGKATGYGRQLERWKAPAAEEGALEEGRHAMGQVGQGAGVAAAAAAAGPGAFQMGGGGGKGWDQFAAFEKMTGNRSTYTEEQYTTALDKSDPRMRAIEAQAARIAREIERGQPSEPLDDSGMSEEDKFSRVLQAPAEVKAPAAAAPKAKSSGLNPNAKPFKFNANAAAFVPGAKKPVAAAAAAAAAGAAAAGARFQAPRPPMPPYSPMVLQPGMPGIIPSYGSPYGAPMPYTYQQQQQQQPPPQ